MFPNVRLMIAAMLASVVVLVCGFGIFAAFRVSREPIAHLPAAALPLQLIAENRAAFAAMVITQETPNQHSQIDIPAGPSEETAAPADISEQHGQGEPVTESEQTTKSRPVAALDAAPSAAPEPEKEAAATAAPLRRAPMPVSELPAPFESGDRSLDVAADTTSASAPFRTVVAAAEPPTAGNGQAASETAAAAPAPGGTTTSAETFASKTTLVPDPEPAAVAHAAVEAMLDDAAERDEIDTPIEPPPLPRARPSASAGQHVGDAQNVSDARPPSAARERPRSAATMRPKRARAITRAVRAVRFASPYYHAEAQYAQSIDASYGYGQSNYQTTQEQIVVRRAVLLRPARLAARKANSAMGGPFVSVRSP